MNPSNQINVKSASKFYREMGLGQPPDAYVSGPRTADGQLAGPVGIGDMMDAVKKALEVNFLQVPVIEYVAWTTTVPLTDAQVTSTFGDTINPLGGAAQVPGILSVDSSFVINGLLQVDMICLGFGVHIFGEPLAFTVPGNSIEPAPANGTAPLVSPDVFTQNDLANGALGATSGINPATMEWGVADWNAAWHMANGYEFQWLYQQRHLLVKELAADVCYFGPYAEALAAGTSDIEVQQYIRQVNDTYRTQGGGGIFAPINWRRVGSATVNQNNVGIFRATRDFDQANCTWGGIRNQGATGCCNPFRRLSRPVLLEKGIPIGMQLVAKDQYHQAQMQRYLSISESQGGNLATVAYDQSVGAGGLAGTGVSPVGLELTLDANPVPVPQRVQTNRVLYKGGTIKVAILIKGYEVTGEWKQLVASYPGVLNVGGVQGMSGVGAAALHR
jgi:hypothetical protein